MTWVAVAVVGGGALAAGGSVAGGLLSKPKAGAETIPPSFNPTADPLNALNTADLLASQGFYLPSIFQTAGPIESAIQAFRGAPQPGGKKAQVALQVAINALQTGDISYVQSLYDPAAGNAANTAGALLNQIVNGSGYSSVQELLDAQKQYQTQVAKQNEQFQNIAGLSYERRGLVEQGLTNIARNPLDINSIRADELARLNRNLDLSQTGALRAASTGGYNPGRVLEGIGRQRQDADLTALTSAIAALGGQAQSIANLNALNPANRAQSLAPGVVRQPTITGTPQPGQQLQNPFGSAVAGASNQLGGTISSLGLLQLLNQNKPAVGGALSASQLAALGG